MAITGTPEDYIANLRQKFGWEEYLVFAIVLSMSAAIGIFHGFFSRRSQSNEEFLMGINFKGLIGFLNYLTWNLLM